MEREKGPRISIIMPVYQVKNYLKRCLKSILNQTFQDYEIILVDDGSTDGSAQICDEFQEKYGSSVPVQVIHNQNEGASAARNCGIAHARGELFTFIDSDDALMPDFLEVMEKVMRENSVRLVQAGYTSEQKEYAEHKQGERIDFRIYSNAEAFEKYIRDEEITGYIWGKLYDRSLFDDITYPVNITHGQDSYTTFKFILRAEKMAFVTNDLYYYFRHPDTLTGSFSPKRMKLLGVAQEMRNFAHQEGYWNIPEIPGMIDGYEIGMNFMMLNYFIGHQEDKNYKEELKQVRRRILSADWENPYIKRKYRLMRRLLQAGFPLYRTTSAFFQKLFGCTYW